MLRNPGQLAHHADYGLALESWERQGPPPPHQSGLDPAAAQSQGIKDYLVSAVVAGLIALAFVALAPACRHWCILPLWLAGLIVGSDAVRWLARKFDLYDPKGLIGILGFHAILVAPLIVVAAEAEPPADLHISYHEWPLAIGRMALFNVFGLIAYKFGQRLMFASGRPSKKDWQIDKGSAAIVLPAALLVCLTVKLAYLARVGGISGLIALVSASAQAELLTGTGWMLMLSDPLPVVLTYTIAVFYSPLLREGKRPTFAPILLLVGLSVLSFLLAGFTGSRSATVYLIFQIAGIVHFFIRPISRKFVIIGFSALLGFMYLYMFYKHAGSEVTALLEGTSGLRHLEKETGKSFLGMLVGDLSRADVDAYLLYRLVEKPEEYDLRYGKTYFDAPSLVIPKSWRPFFHEGQSAGRYAGTELMSGRGSFHLTRRTSSRAYGVAGEAMLNFGYWGIVPMFGVWGLLVGWYRKKAAHWRIGDGRFLAAPFVTLFLVIMLMSQSSNLGYLILAGGALPVLCLILICRKTPIDGI